MAKAIEAWSMKAQKKVNMEKGATIDITSNGRYFAKGVDKEGNKLAVAMGKASAEQAIKDGIAKKGTGW